MRRARKNTFISELRPKEVWDMWRTVLKHDRDNPPIDGRRPYGSEKELAEKLLNLGYIKDIPYWYVKGLEQIREVIDKYNITLESKLDDEGIIEANTPARGLDENPDQLLQMETTK